MSLFCSLSQFYPVEVILLSGIGQYILSNFRYGECETEKLFLY